MALAASLLRRVVLIYQRHFKMARDDSKLNFYSGWEIDQQTQTNTVGVGAGDTAIVAVSGYPLYELQFKPNGSNYWFRSGVSCSDGATGGIFAFYGYLEGGYLKVHSDIAGTVRYFIYSDKVNY